MEKSNAESTNAEIVTIKEKINIEPKKRIEILNRPTTSFLGF